MTEGKFHNRMIFCRFLMAAALLFIVLPGLRAQKLVEYDKIKSFNIIVNYNDCTIKTQMLKEAVKTKPDEDFVYHWYASNKIMSTQGGFDGKLLHGYYHCFYLNNNLKEAGSFKYGIKTGEWRSWYEDGKLKDVVSWKKGKKNGKYKLYSPVGDLIAEGNFKDDRLNGKFKNYSGGKVAETLKYKNGELVIKKSKVKSKKLKEDPSTSSGTKKESGEPKAKKHKKSLKERWKGMFKKDKAVESGTNVQTKQPNDSNTPNDSGKKEKKAKEPKTKKDPSTNSGAKKDKKKKEPKPSTGPGSDTKSGTN